MITKEELNTLILHLKPYRYRCISKGLRVTNGLNEEVNNDFLYDIEDLYYDYSNDEELYYMQKIWFEIVGINETMEEIHIGYITGYYINMELLMMDADFGEESESLFEFDGNSHLTMELWHYIMNSDLGQMHQDYYFMNSITIHNKYYDIPEIESTAIKLIRQALYDIYRYEVSSIIYSIGRTELDDDTVCEDYTTYNDIEFNRHRKNLLNMGFKSFKDNGEEIYLFKDFHSR